jgi:hypothetical protein
VTPDEIFNEHLKLGAIYLNGLAIATVTAGTFGPIISYSLGLIPNVGAAVVFVASAACFVMSAAIHLIAQSILGALR